MKILSIIPARGGSKRIPNKNLLMLGDIPLIGHTINHSLSSKYITKSIVSSDSEKILTYAKKFDKLNIIKRKKNISGDYSTTEDVIVDVLNNLGLENYEPDIVVLFQVTSPIRHLNIIDKAIEKFINNESDSLLSVTKNHSFLWKKGINPQPINYDYKNRPMSQDFNNQFIENGSFYIFKPWLIHKNKCRIGGKISLFEMDFWSSFEIDNIEDYNLIKYIFETKFK